MGLAKKLDSPTLDWMPERQRLHAHAPGGARSRRQGGGRLSAVDASPARAGAAGGWQASLALRYMRREPRTVVHDRHDGPLRVLRSLYPEGDAICHSVLLHPPGGVVGGDTLAVHVEVEAGAHALLTTPGATRFYRSTGATAAQSLTARVAAGARLEWLPLEPSPTAAASPRTARASSSPRAPK